MNDTTLYVATLLFNHERTKVALVHKLRGPKPVISKWNAIGGHVEVGEESWDAAFREFREETSMSIDPIAFMSLCGSGWNVDFYKAFNDHAIQHVCTTTDETIEVFYLRDLPTNLVPNLLWIIPMALGHQDDNVRHYIVQEALPIVIPF